MTCTLWSQTTRTRRPSRPRGGLYGIAVALIIVAAAPLATRAEDGPRVVVTDLTDSVIVVLKDKSLSSADKRHKIEEIGYGAIDFDTVSRLVLARNWRKFSPAQQDQFVKEFKTHLSVTYGNNIENYRNERVEIVGDRSEARGDWTVQTIIRRGGGAEDIKVDYRLREKDGRWRIIDVIVEGVSLVSNFRSQFQTIVANEGPEKLLQLLHEKNERGESLKS